MWGSDWDPLFARDEENVIIRRLHETVDGEFQKYAATDGRFNRENFFNKYPELQKIVAHLSDEDIDRLRRGGHDPIKIYGAYRAAVNYKARPTVILAQTKKGYGMGHWAQGRMGAHQAKKLEDDALLAFRDRFALPLSDDDVRNLRFHKLPEESPEMRYLRAQRDRLGGYVPARNGATERLQVPPLQLFARTLEGSGEREDSTTMVFVRHALPASEGPGDRQEHRAHRSGRGAHVRHAVALQTGGDLLVGGPALRPGGPGRAALLQGSESGQILEEGINEAGAISSWIAAATSYRVHGVPMLPFYIFYSMFGFQRVGDFIWAAADARARGFLIGATAGRTTLSGEGLQHEDGSSHLVAATVPSCRAYDPCFGYELAAIVREGMRRMLDAQEDVFYYVTVMNENYTHGAMPANVHDGILRGMYLVRRRRAAAKGAWEAPSVQLLGSGTILREALAAAELLEQEFRHRRERLERDELHRAAPRRARGRALEYASSDGVAAHEPCRGVPFGYGRTDHRGKRLRSGASRPHPHLGAAPLRDTRDRRLRPQRHARKPAELL